MWTTFASLESGIRPAFFCSGRKRGCQMLTGKETRLLEALEPTAREKGIEIVSIEIVGSRKAPTIRVFIDTPDGVSFDALASAQSWINEIMDAIDPFPGAYMLEVSSPGIDRPLRTPEHFQRFSGQEAQIVLRAPIDGRSKFTGMLKGFADGAVLLLVGGADEVTSINYDAIKRAHLKGSVDFHS